MAERLYQDRTGQVATALHDYDPAKPLGTNERVVVMSAQSARYHHQFSGRKIRKPAAEQVGNVARWGDDLVVAEGNPEALKGWLQPQYEKTIENVAVRGSKKHPLDARVMIQFEGETRWQRADVQEVAMAMPKAGEAGFAPTIAYDHSEVADFLDQARPGADILHLQLKGDGTVEVLNVIGDETAVLRANTLLAYLGVPENSLARMRMSV